MDYPTTEEAFGERGPRGQFQEAPSLLHGHASVVLVWEQMTRPVHTSVHAPQMSPGMTQLLVPLLSRYKSLVGKAKSGPS